MKLLWSPLFVWEGRVTNRSRRCDRCGLFFFFPLLVFQVFGGVPAVEEWARLMHTDGLDHRAWCTGQISPIWWLLTTLTFVLSWTRNVGKTYYQEKKRKEKRERENKSRPKHQRRPQRHAWGLCPCSPGFSTCCKLSKYPIDRSTFLISCSPALLQKCNPTSFFPRLLFTEIKDIQSTKLKRCQCRW